jgi:hypothetical protein
MLHVTNGDSAAGVIRASGVEGDVIAWRDVLHEGPVPARLPMEELSGVRARFIAERGWGTAGEAARSFRERDAALAALSEHDELVLWFEHDLYDQLQLLQVLDWLGDHDAGATRVTMVVGDEYLGLSTPGRLAQRFAARAEVSEAQVELAEDAWNAFRSPDPTAIESFLAHDDGATLPYLAPALRRHLEQFPSARNGLSRSEQQALEAIDGGAATVRDAYLQSHHRREEPIWLGDSTFAAYLEDLARGGHPLVALGDGDAADPASALARTVALTDAGREVLAGRADRARLNGIDRWLGGVHLRGRDLAWRWDTDAGRLVRG